MRETKFGSGNSKRLYYNRNNAFVEKSLQCSSKKTITEINSYLATIL